MTNDYLVINLFSSENLLLNAAWYSANLNIISKELYLCTYQPLSSCREEKYDN